MVLHMQWLEANIDIWFCYNVYSYASLIGLFNFPPLLTLTILLRDKERNHEWLWMEENISEKKMVKAEVGLGRRGSHHACK